MLRIRLDPEARERYGCAEWLEVDYTRLSNTEAMTLDDLGIGYGQWFDMLNTKPTSARTWTILVWLALTRAGHRVGFEDVVFDLRALDKEESDDDAGKEPDSEN